MTVLQTFTDEEFEEIFAHYDQVSLLREIHLIKKLFKKDNNSKNKIIKIRDEFADIVLLV